jgi:hypothetical protein
VSSYSAGKIPPRDHRPACAQRFPADHLADRQGGHAPPAGERLSADRSRIGLLHADPEHHRIRRLLGESLSARPAEALHRAEPGSGPIGGTP